MKRIVVLATGGAGGDLQPLVAAALGLTGRGHQLFFIGDPAVARAIQPLGLDTAVLPSDLDLGPRILAAIRDSQGLPEDVRGDFVKQRLTAWAEQVVPVVRDAVSKQSPDLLLTSLFGAGVAHLATVGQSVPWAVINSTFYVGPNPPRPLELDFAPRALPLFRDFFVPLLEHAPLVLHATDPVFDYSHNGLPPGHHYVGPLIWEPAVPPPPYLDEPGSPWVLVTLSSQLQDDVPLARMAIESLAELPVRVLLTVGSGHQENEVGPLPKNACLEQYVSHSAVLQKSRLLLSHAGHGSVMKALWHGVPMVLVPWGRDQPGVAARAEHVGAARVIPREELTAPLLGEAIQDVMGDSRYRQNASEISRHLVVEDPVATACGFLEQA